MTNWFSGRATGLALGAMGLLAACATGLGDADSPTTDPTSHGTHARDAGEAGVELEPNPEGDAQAHTEADAEADAQADAGADADAHAEADAGTDADTSADAGADAHDASLLCPTPLAAGDLAIVELMIQSATGTGDRGEWIEVQSTRDCPLDLRGLHVESPRGTSNDTLDVTSSMILPPRGIFLIANSTDSILNHDLPAPLLVWDGSPSDVLKNDGDTITITSGTTPVESLTYPSLTLYPGTSISFPADCAPSDRATWGRWSYSTKAYSGAFDGTPNAANTDVTCF